MNTNYIKQYKKLYEIKKTYGQTSTKLYDIIIPYIDKYKPKKILDFGCGKSKLSECIENERKVAVYKYDPAIKEYSKIPSEKIDFTICTDVLQHIPLFDLNRVLTQIKMNTIVSFFYIKCTRHTTLLPNGEYANCTVYPPEWWQDKLQKYFSIVERIKIDDETSVAFIAINM